MENVQKKEEVPFEETKEKKQVPKEEDQSFQIFRMYNTVDKCVYYGFAKNFRDTMIYQSQLCIKKPEKGVINKVTYQMIFTGVKHWLIEPVRDLKAKEVDILRFRKELNEYLDHILVTQEDKDNCLNYHKVEGGNHVYIYNEWYC